MSYKPILFNTEMVKAIMAGRKTQTRRLIKCNDGSPFVPGRMDEYSNNKNAKGQPYHSGDILWVRETWHKDAGRYMYRANYAGDEKFYRDGKEVLLCWSPSIHMPKEAARIFLRVKDVRMEQLNDILAHAGEVAKEGIPYSDAGDIEASGLRFKELWNSTIKPTDLDEYGWNANPWVWVIEFEKVEKPEWWR